MWKTNRVRRATVFYLLPALTHQSVICQYDLLAVKYLSRIPAICYVEVFQFLYGFAEYRQPKWGRYIYVIGLRRAEDTEHWLVQRLPGCLKYRRRVLQHISPFRPCQRHRITQALSRFRNVCPVTHIVGVECHAILYRLHKPVILQTGVPFLPGLVAVLEDNSAHIQVVIVNKQHVRRGEYIQACAVWL